MTTPPFVNKPFDLGKPQNPYSHPWPLDEMVDRVLLHRETQINRIIEKVTNDLRRKLVAAEIITVFEKFEVMVDVKVVPL